MKTSNIVLDIVTNIIVHIYIDFTSRLLKQIWIFPYQHGFCNPIRIHGMKINDMMWYDSVWSLISVTIYQLTQHDTSEDVTILYTSLLICIPTYFTDQLNMRSCSYCWLNVSHCLSKCPCYCAKQ